MLHYTTIQHWFRKENDISCNEYVLLDMIYFLQSRGDSQFPGWCYAKKESLAEYTGLTKRAILKMIARLSDKGLIIINLETRHVKTSKKWEEVYFEGEQSSQGVNKVPERGEQSSRHYKKEYISNTRRKNIFDNSDEKNQSEPLPFPTPSFKTIWQEWLDYRKERRFPSYKPIGLKKTFKDLTQLSGGDEQTAVSIIEQSIAKGWQGLFQLKNSNQLKNPYPGKRTMLDELEEKRRNFKPIFD